VDLAALEEKLRGAGEVSRTAFSVRARLGGGMEMVVFADGRAVVSGTRDAARARSVYARYVG
jgi:adenylyltransferase/sulfurtransferase